MRFIYKLARSARRNLQEIADYWMARAGEGVALRIVSGILETIITLSSQPRQAHRPSNSVMLYGSSLPGSTSSTIVSVRPRQSRSCTCSTEREIDRKRGWAKQAAINSLNAVHMLCPRLM